MAKKKKSRATPKTAKAKSKKTRSCKSGNKKEAAANAAKQGGPKRITRRIAVETPPDETALPADAQPRQIAAIDVGATSVRMQVAQWSPGASVKPLDQLVHPISLGTDTFRLGRVTPVTMRALGEVLANFADVLESYGVTDYAAVGTSAMREAANKDILVDRLRHRSGLHVQVLDAVQESRLTYQGLLPFIRNTNIPSRKHTLVLDLGGGSTESMLLKGERMVMAGTRRLGTSRLFHSVSAMDARDSVALLQSMIRNTVGAVLEPYREYTIGECLLINAALTDAFRSHPKATAIEGGLRVPAEAIRKAARDASEETPDQLCREFSVSRTEGELLAPALMIVGRVVKSLGLKRVFMPEIDFFNGILSDMTMRLRGEDPLESFREMILGSVDGLAHKYDVDLNHAHQVRALADELFDALRGMLDLESRDRLYLEVAAILHDIGSFVSERAHHKHGAYVVENSDIVGLGERERHLISLLVRYHRKAMPGLQHEEFTSLPTESRLRVTKLASLLRMADALDRDHGQRLRGIDVRMGETECLIVADATGDLVVESAALEAKADLFEAITGLQVRLRRRVYET